MLERLLASRWSQMALLLALLCGEVGLSFSHARWREQIRNFTFDNYNIMQPRQASDNVVIVDIDEASLKKIGQMPWPRDVMGKLVTQVKALGAKAIAFDIVFPEADRSSPDNIAKIFDGRPETQDIAERLKVMPDNDAALGAAIGVAGNVVTGFSFTNEVTGSVPAQKGIFRGRDIEKFIPRLSGAAVNLKEISKDAAGNGSFFVSTDTDGVIRRVPMLIGYAATGSDIIGVYPSLALETVRVLDGARGGRVLLADPAYAKLDPQRFGITGIEMGQEGGRVIPTDSRGEFLVYFAKSDSKWYVPAYSVLDGSIAPEKIRDKIVFIGTSAVGLKDIRSTPLNTFVPGVEIHLNIIDQILQGKFLTRSIEAEGLEAVAIFAGGIFIILFAPFIGALAQAAVVALLIAVGIYGGIYAFETRGMLIDVAYPAVSVLALFMVSTILTYLRVDREKRRVRQTFGLYISPAYMNELTRDPGKLKLGGALRELSVMFTDIRNFTGVAEGMGPQELIHLMNDFLTPMSDLVMRNRGTIDKYIGDAMMAFWNAPLDDAEHARGACRAALAMQGALGPVNDMIRAKGGSTLLKVGIGINTGPCAVGNMGSKQRFAYSALGDAANLASRFEGLTKIYGASIIIGEATRNQAPEFAALELDLTLVMGKKKPVRIFALLGDEVVGRSAEFAAAQAAHEEMMTAYRAGDFAKAEKMARSSPLESMKSAYEFYATRIVTLQANPPKNWDGVYEAKGK